MSDLLICVACGDEHADPETATRIGISFVAAECAWTLRYPGQSAAEVIESLEARLDGNASTGATQAVQARSAENGVTAAGPVSDDPAERVAHNQFAQEVLCSVCDGDGELNGDGGPVMCGRCNGSGRVLVTG